MLAYGIAGNIEIFVETSLDISSLQDEKDRILEQIADKKDYLRKIQQKLSNPSFAKNAPEKIVRSEKEKQHQAELQLEKFSQKLEEINAILNQK